MAVVIQAQDEIYFPIHHLQVACHITVMHNKTRSIQYQKIMTVQGGHLMYRLFSYLGKYSLCNHHVYVSIWFRIKNPNLTRKALSHNFIPCNISIQTYVIRIRNTSQLYTGLLQIISEQISDINLTLKEVTLTGWIREFTSLRTNATKCVNKPHEPHFNCHLQMYADL